MSLPCFYVKPEHWQTPLRLTGEEFAHLRVLRLQPGDKIEVMDGVGCKALCQLQQVGKNEAVAQILEQELVAAPTSRCILALALSKAIRRGFFMEKVSELGAWEICLWQARRSQGHLSTRLVEGLRHQLVAGIKQSHNPWLPALSTAANASEVAVWGQNADCRLLPWEEGTDMLLPAQLGHPGTTAFIVGPEGGFDSEELEIFSKAGFVRVSLGRRVLRCETAAVLCLGLAWWAAQLPR